MTKNIFTVNIIVSSPPHILTITLTSDIYKMVHSRPDFHQMYYDAQRKHPKMIAVHHDPTNNQKIHHVSVAQLYSTVYPTDNTIKIEKKRTKKRRNGQIEKKNRNKTKRHMLMKK